MGEKKITGLSSICHWQSTQDASLRKDKSTLQFSVNHKSSATATTMQRGNWTKGAGNWQTQRITDKAVRKEALQLKTKKRNHTWK